MKRKASFRLFVTSRKELFVHDVVGHTLSLVELEGEPIDYVPGAAGEFVSRRSVGFHDRKRGFGPMQGYAITHYQHGSVYSRFEGFRDGSTRVTKGTWETYKGTGELFNIRGRGSFNVQPSPEDEPGDFILEMEGDYEL